MKIQLNDGRLAILGVQFGKEQPDPKPGVVRQPVGEFRSVRMTLSLFSQDGSDLGSVSGVSYCNPNDRFVRTTGRMLAMRRLLDNDRTVGLLSVGDRAQLCPVMLTGRR
jgi:hypothetical protein